MSKPVLTTFLLVCAVLLPLSFLMPAAKAVTSDHTSGARATHGAAHR